MKKKIFGFIALALCVILLVSCSANPGASMNRQYGGAMKVAVLRSQELTKPDGQSDSARGAANGANDFAFRFSASLLEKMDVDANFICSPYSAWLPLAALLNATDETARPALLEALGAAGLTAEDINTAASRMLYGLTASRMNEYNKEAGLESHDPLQIANAIFVDDGKTLNPDFAQTFADYYLGAAMEVDFASPDAVRAVNQWASDNTDGLITDVIQEFDPDTVAAIANAIYFSDRWDWEFREDQTTEDVFHAPGGDVTASFMRREGDNQSYYEDDVLQAMPLRFSLGGGLAILLPKDGDAVGLLKSLTNERFTEIMRSMKNKTGKLLLPRFEIAGDTMDIRTALQTLDIPLFDANAAVITGLLEDEYPLCITDAVQKAMIKVDEKGTTAAAVTVYAMAESAMAEQTAPFEMVCDSPFVFILYGDTYDGGNQVLFTGVVNRP
jgi:serpin B